jgi:hypothetical protein
MGRPRTAAKRRQGRRKAARRLARLAQLRTEMVVRQEVADGSAEWVAPLRAAAEASEDWIIRLDARLVGLRACGWHSGRQSEDEIDEHHRQAMLAAFRAMWRAGKRVPGIWAWWIGLHWQQRDQLVRMTVACRGVDREIRAKKRGL